MTVVYVRPQTEEEGRQSPPVMSDDATRLKEEIERIGAKTVLEFGPGETTQMMLDLGVEKIVTCEYIDKWLEVAKERFKDEKRVTVTKFYDEMPVTVDGLTDKDTFDLGFVDAPKGFNPVRKRHPGYEDCSRLNTVVYALDRCKVVVLHDANRPLERATLTRLWASGLVEITFLTGNIVAARITKREQRQDGPNPQDAAKPGSSTPRAKPKRGRKPVNRRSDRPDTSGAQDKASVSG